MYRSTFDGVVFSSKMVVGGVGALPWVTDSSTQSASWSGRAGGGKGGAPLLEAWGCEDADNPYKARMALVLDKAGASEAGAAGSETAEDTLRMESCFSSFLGATSSTEGASLLFLRSLRTGLPCGLGLGEEEVAFKAFTMRRTGAVNFTPLVVERLVRL